MIKLTNQLQTWVMNDKAIIFYDLTLILTLISQVVMLLQSSHTSTCRCIPLLQLPLFVMNCLSVECYCEWTFISQQGAGAWIGPWSHCKFVVCVLTWSCQKGVCVSFLFFNVLIVKIKLGLTVREQEGGGIMR